MNGYQIKRIEGLRKVIDQLSGFELSFAESMLEKLGHDDYELSDKQNHALNQICQRYKC